MRKELPFLQCFNFHQVKSQQKNLYRARFYLLSATINIINLYWDLLWFIYSISLKEFDKTLVKSVQVKTRPYIKECYNECWWWVRITIMNAIDVWTLLCPDYNYLQPLELHACFVIHLSISRTVRWNRRQLSRSLIKLHWTCLRTILFILK